MKYGVKVVFTYSVGPNSQKFYEESVYLVEAESFDDAYKKVEEYTKDFDLEYTNPKGQVVKMEKVDFLDFFIAFDEENGVQEIYSSISKNKSSLSEKDFYEVITNQCNTEEMYALRYKEFN